MQKMSKRRSSNLNQIKLKNQNHLKCNLWTSQGGPMNRLKLLLEKPKIWKIIMMKPNKLDVVLSKTGHQVRCACSILIQKSKKMRIMMPNLFSQEAVVQMPRGHSQLLEALNVLETKISKKIITFKKKQILVGKMKIWRRKEMMQRAQKRIAEEHRSEICKNNNKSLRRHSKRSRSNSTS